MNLRMVGCTHHEANVEIRERLAFDAHQAHDALARWQNQFAGAELALLATCNRVELYAAGNGTTGMPPTEKMVDALLKFHEVPRQLVEGHLLTLSDRDVVHHLYRVAASLESMVVGEPQILSQVKQAYRIAQQASATGPMLHELFQSSLRTAKRVAGETSLHRHRVSIPSVAIDDLATRVFETFDDKHVLVIGSGEMADETLCYLHNAGKPKIHVVNRSAARGQALAERWSGQYHAWDELSAQLIEADLAVSTTSADEPVVTAKTFNDEVAPKRHQRPLFVLDLAVPRDFDPQIGEVLGVYLYSMDDLDQVCETNRAARAAELPAAEGIVLAETDRFLAETNHRRAAPVITDLRAEFERPKAAELERLFQKIPHLDDQSREEIERFADRLVNKLLHPPLESLRNASHEGTHQSLLDALRRLFRIED